MYTILASSDLNAHSGSASRPLNQILGLYENDFYDFKAYGSIKISNKNALLGVQKRSENNIYHAHQLAAALCVYPYDFIFDMHGYGRFERKEGFGNNIFSLFLNSLEDKLIKKSKKIVVPNEYIKNLIEKNFDKEIHVIRNSIGVDHYKEFSCKERMICVIGSFKSNYNREVLKYMNKILKCCDYEFKLIGDMYQSDALLFEKNKHVHLIGKIPFDSYINELRNSSICLLPYSSTCYGGGTKIKLLEAGACSLPIVSTLGGAIGFKTDLIKIGHNVKELIDQIEELDNHKLRLSVGRKIRKYIEANHNRKTESKKIISLYDGYFQ